MNERQIAEKTADKICAECLIGKHSDQYQKVLEYLTEHDKAIMAEQTCEKCKHWDKEGGIERVCNNHEDIRFKNEFCSDFKPKEKKCEEVMQN